MNKIYSLIFILFLISCSKNKESEGVINLKNENDSSSYAIGADLGENLKSQGIEIDYSAFLSGIKNSYESKEHLLSKEDRRLAFQSLQNKVKSSQENKAVENSKIAEDFLKKIKTNDNDIVETKTGLLYKVIKSGNGKKPTSMDQVQVNYEGRLIDNTIFDSSYEKGEPATFRLNRVIKGWTEGLQLMSPGAEYTFYIPPSLGYGARGSQSIPPNSALIFKVELMKVFPPNMK